MRSVPVSDDDVVLTGLSGRLPESNSIEEFAQQLFAGVDLVTADDRRWTPGLYGLPERSGKLKDLSHFDAGFFGVHAKQTQAMDPQLRLLLEVTHEAMVDAGYNPTELRGSRTGVYVGVCFTETAPMLTVNVDKINGYSLTGCINSMFANRVSYSFDLKGPSLALDTACSSAMFGLVQAVNDIRAGTCDAAIVAGTNLCLDPVNSVQFNALTMLSPDGRCASFDASGNGYVRAEAIVAVLLQRRRESRRLYCTVHAAGFNNDGYKAEGINYPAGAMQLRLAQEVFKQANLRPQDVSYVEAHGTGTKAGDPEEMNAIVELYCKDRKSPLLVGAVKSNMGHPEPTSGLCSITKVVLAMERGVIPGNLHFKTPNPNIPALSDGRVKIIDKNTPWQGGLVTVNSFGFGGSNTHVILESHDGERPPPADYSAPRLVLASGRTDEAVERLLGLAAEHPRDAELHALLDAVHARAIPGHPRRGYAVLDPARGAPPVLEVLECEDEPRPVWFVFSGMGSQWAGMARTLMRLPAFAASIARSAAALEPHGVDLINVITEAPDTAFENIINSFVSIAAVQVAMVDVLRELGIRPDGIIGHSVGEIGCAYADETLTAEQTVLCAYWRGRCTLDARPPPGAMAAVGLSWEEAARRCPGDVELACHNSDNSVTISGPLSSVEKFVEQLSADGVFVRLVNTSRIAFHSKYIAAVAPLLRERLLQVISEPKQRSARWLSSSVPQDQWDSEQAKLSDAGYHVNNLLSPVRFAPLLARVPALAVVVEVAPHALLQAVLKRALLNALYVPLVRRDAPDALTHLLAAVGKIYAAGVQPQVSRLYPTIPWPVSRGTPGLASHIGWDHSIEWNVVDYKNTSRTGENYIEYDLSLPDDAFLAGHNIDGRILFPATGYLMLVWRTIAKLNNLKMDEAAVVIEDVQFRRATIMTRDSPLRFFVMLLSGTGQFEICEGGAVVVTGTARLTKDPASERLPADALDDPDEKEDDLSLDSEDIYKEFHLRGYNYNGLFCGIKSSDAHGTHGQLSWVGNWISYIDTMLQFYLIGKTSRELYLPTRLQFALIDPVEQRSAVAAAGAPGGTVPIKCFRSLGVTVAGGVELRGMNASLASRRVNVQAEPKLEKYTFVPLDGTCGSEDAARSKRDALTTVLHLALENCGELLLKIAEPALQQGVEDLLLPYAMQVLDSEPMLRVEAMLAAGADAAQYAASMDPLGVKVSNKDATSGGLEANCHIVLAANVLTRRDAGVLTALVTATAANGFVMLEEPARSFEEPDAQAMLTAAGLSLVSHACTASRSYLLLHLERPLPPARVVVEARDDDYGWLELLQAALRRAESSDMRVYVWSRAHGSGVLGLGTCARREAGGARLRVYYLPGAAHEFDPDAPAYRAQVRRDLAFNVLRAGVWGTFRHLPLDDAVLAQRPVEHAFVNTLTRGDLSSLRWVESELKYATSTPQLQRPVCRVHYSALNFRDIMHATSKLPPDALPEVIHGQECLLGLEYSGRLANGKRVMGAVACKGLATTLVPDESFTWEVPERWSLEEAATVPIAYMTAYYGLIIRGRMHRGESVLVHAGTGGVGLAAIAIALHAGCTVFATVGSPEKRAFLRERFPQLLDANIGNSRDCSFEQLVLRRTRGRGVDLVLNSLAGDKLKASVRCLAGRGRFLEIGKLDLSANTPLGMAVLLKNTTVHGILLDYMFDESTKHLDKVAVIRCVTEGLAAGVVRPLPTTVFADDQLEQAFRYMATGKHIGKVLIRVCEEAGGEPAPARLVPAVPRTYMHPAKSYVLIGGLGGFGLELGEWLIGRGARTLVLNSRSGVRTGYQAWCIRRWREKGVLVLVSMVDVTTEAGARALLKEAAAISPVGGIFNLAAVLRDALIENQTQDNFCAVVRPKINVTRALDVASRSLAPQLEHFVVFSSVSCGRGNAGQSNYGLANSGMERLCERRREEGLPALAVQWGAVGDVGLVAAMRGRGADEEVGGTVPQRIASCLHALDVLMTTPHAVVSSLVRADKRRAQPTQELVQTVANILGIRDPSKVSDSATLVSLGMDSLMGAEIKQTLERHDVMLGVQEVRALTFATLRAIGSGGASAGPAKAAEDCDFSEIFRPEQVLVTLPSLPPANPEDGAVFMVHPIEGVVSMLLGVAARVRGAVFGLQCTGEAPLDDMAALARYYVARVRSAQPHAPYTLLGYSYGAAVAFEMALQLESEGCPTRLVLVDGSPAYISSHTTHGKNKCSAQTQQHYECDALAYFVQVYHDVDTKKAAELASELLRLPDSESRLTHVIEIFAKTGARVDKSALRTLVHNFFRKLVIADSYLPSGRVQGPVTLFTASDSRVALGADYGLREVCAGELRTRRLPGTHRSILEGDAARSIADHVSELLALQ